MQIQVNGETRSVDPGATVADLVATLDLDGKPFAVEINRAVVPKSKHAAHPLQAQDEVEIVTVVGGG